MRLALLAALLLTVAGCDSADDDVDRGTFSLALSGARTATLAGDAGFLLASCRAPRLTSGETSVYLNTGCDEYADGVSSDRIRRGTFPVAADRQSGAFLVTVYDDATRSLYRGTVGTVTITEESDSRISGRLDVEARPVDGDTVVDTTAAPLHLSGTFDAVGFVGLD